MIDLQKQNYFLILHQVLFSTKKRTYFWDRVPFFLDSSLGIPYRVLWLNVCDNEHLVLRNNFRVTKKFLITRFDCINFTDEIMKTPPSKVGYFSKSTRFFLVFIVLEIYNFVPMQNFARSKVSFHAYQIPKPSLKIRTANAIFWIYLGIFRDYSLKKILF